MQTFEELMQQLEADARRDLLADAVAMVARVRLADYVNRWYRRWAAIGRERSALLKQRETAEQQLAFLDQFEQLTAEQQAQAGAARRALESVGAALEPLTAERGRLERMLHGAAGLQWPLEQSDAISAALGSQSQRLEAMRRTLDQF